MHTGDGLSRSTYSMVVYCANPAIVFLMSCPGQRIIGFVIEWVNLDNMELLSSELHRANAALVTNNLYRDQRTKAFLMLTRMHCKDTWLQYTHLSIRRLTTLPDPCCSTISTHREHRCAEMVPLYQARIEDLGPGDFVKVDCAACSHTALLSAASLGRLGLCPGQKVLDLKDRLRCQGCGVRGRAVTSVK